MTTISELLKEEARLRLDEGRQRIHACLGKLNEEQIWRRANKNTVSLGNLVLHLCGNVRQWITTTLAGEADIRQRDLEFNETAPIANEELLSRLDAVVDRALEVIASLDEEQLLRSYHVQAYTPSGVGIVVHVTEHFSYHVGQITLHTKLMLDIDTGYYNGVVLG